MKKSHSIIALLFILLGSWNCSSPPNTNSVSDLAFQEVHQTAKPWTRWWWHGSSVTPEGITAELEAYAKAGIGGLELTPIYGVKGLEDQFVDFLSPQWTELFIHTLQEAERLGLGVDIATGTGWPFGGPWINADLACKNVQYEKYSLKEGESLKEKVEFLQPSLLRTVNSPELKISDLVEPISANKNLQKLALDQVRFEKKLPLQSLMAFSENGEKLDLIKKVDAEGRLDWIAPAGTWQLYAVFQGWHGKMVERAAPGGEGNVIDHFSNAPIEQYLVKFDEAFAGKDIVSLRAFFNDSYEVDDARGQADWTPDLFAEFEKRRGYDLRLYLPALFGADAAETNQRVLSDYRETISDLLLETFTTSWSAWAKKNGAIIRNQAHGSPANILDLYAASDIPETEGVDIIKAKMASSAAHVSGKPFASAEAATWLGEHFTTNLVDLKENIDRYWAGGINHVFYHGTTYSPPEEAWPGRLFYAAIHANPRNPLWHDYPAFNTYIARTQAFLQSGKPDNDILLYFPAYDRFASSGHGLLEHFDGWAAPRDSTSNVRTTALWLQDNGYGFDFMSDLQVEGLVTQDGQVKTADLAYRAILVPETTYMPLTTLQKLATLSEEGATIIFQKLPESVPGLSDLDNRQEAFKALLSKLQSSKAIVQNDLSSALTKAQVAQEKLVDQGLEFHRRSYEDGYIYFLSNWSEKNVDAWLPIATSFETAAIFDPMTGKSGFADLRVQNGQTEIYLQLARGESCILKTFSANASGEKWRYLKKKNDPIALNGPWTLTFQEGGPELPAEQTLEVLSLWTDLSGDIFQKFSGTAVYSIQFDQPVGDGSGWLLDLGNVAESAAVKINGQEAGTAIGPVYQLFIPQESLSEKNTLEIAVSNSMANRIIDMEKSGLRWQNFYNINISARLRENLGADRVFTTVHWPTSPSGMDGPVTLTLIE